MFFKNNRLGVGTSTPNRVLEVNAASAPVRVTDLQTIDSGVPSSDTAPLMIDASTGMSTGENRQNCSMQIIILLLTLELMLMLQIIILEPGQVIFTIEHLL